MDWDPWDIEFSDTFQVDDLIQRNSFNPYFFFGRNIFPPSSPTAELVMWFDGLELCMKDFFIRKQSLAWTFKATSEPRKSI